MVNLRAAIFVGLVSFIALLDIIGIAVPMLISDSFPSGGDTSGNSRMAYSTSVSGSAFKFCMETAIVTTCVTGSTCAGQGVSVTETCETSVPDTCHKGSIMAMRAFGIMSVLVALLACIPLGVLDLLGKFPMPNMTKFAMAGAAGVLLFFEVIFWMVFFIMFNMKCPETGDKSYSEMEPFKTGAGPIIFIVTSVLTIGLIVVAIVAPAPDAEAATKSSDVDSMMAPMNASAQPARQQGGFHDDL